MRRGGGPTTADLTHGNAVTRRNAKALADNMADRTTAAEWTNGQM